ncbi:GIY-YIG nuclease family protein [Streptosporangium sp. NPDC051022]|uniref:GIY-YIG nuclease family protein n=1 Tax=Streptosporangium sp. NPDC051022 TaxID=3155752 RepID=UPI0034254239
MQWVCPSCHKSAALVDFSGDELQVIGCIECDWNQVLQADSWGEHRCVNPCESGRRCSQSAGLGGRCWQHARKEAAWESVYRRFRNAGDDEIPEAYRQIFTRALLDANIVIRDEEHQRQLQKRAAEQRVQPERAPSLIYFVQREGLIKIGVTTNLTNRLKALSRGSCMPPGMTVGPVELLATEPGDRCVEGRLHTRFRKTRIQGTEWFRPSKALRNYIDDLTRIQKDPNHFFRRINAA